MNIFAESEIENFSFQHYNNFQKMGKINEKYLLDACLRIH
jgi:hypothetical protein